MKKSVLATAVLALAFGAFAQSQPKSEVKKSEPQKEVKAEPKKETKADTTKKAEPKKGGVKKSK